MLCDIRSSADELGQSHAHSLLATLLYIEIGNALACVGEVATARSMLLLETASLPKKKPATKQHIKGRSNLSKFDFFFFLPSQCLFSLYIYVYILLLWKEAASVVSKKGTTIPTRFLCLRWLLLTPLLHCDGSKERAVDGTACIE